MCGGLNEVTTSRRCYDKPAVRNRLRGQLLDTVTVTDTNAITRADAGGRIIVCRHPRGSLLAREQGLHARRHRRGDRNDGDMDEQRFGVSHIDVGCTAVGLRGSSTRRTVLDRLTDCGNLRLPLHDSPGDGRDGRRSVNLASELQILPTPPPAPSA